MLFTPADFNSRVEDQLISWIVCDCEQHGRSVAGLSEAHWLGGDSMTGNWNHSHREYVITLLNSLEQC